MDNSPDLSKLHVTFCKVWFHIEQDDKLEPQAIEGVFVGYDVHSKNHYSILVYRDQKVYCVTNLIFLEDQHRFISKETGPRDLAEDSDFQNVYSPNRSHGVDK